MNEGGEGEAGAWVSIVDPDPQSRDALAGVLVRLAVEVRTYDAAETFLAHLHGVLPACLITEVRLPAMSGLMLLRHLKSAGKSVPTIVVAADPDVAMAVEAIREGAVDFVEKPCLEARIARRVWAIVCAHAPRAA